MTPAKYKRILVAIYDLLAVAAACFLGYVLRLDGLPAHWLESALTFAGLSVLAAALIFPWIGINRGMWRYASLRDTLAILYGATSVIVLTVIALFFLTRLDMVPRSAIIIAWMAIILLMALPRFILRAAREDAFGLNRMRAPERNDGIRNVVIFGINDEAEAFLRLLNRSRKPEYNVVALIDPTRRLWGSQLRGVPIISLNKEGLGKTLPSQNMVGELDGFILSHQGMRNDDMQMVLDYATSNGLRVYRFPDRMPNPYEDRRLLENIRLEDLLQREPASVDMAGISHLLEGKTVLVTGCGGTIGSTLVGFILKNRIRKLVLLDNSELGIYRTLNQVRESGQLDCSHHICSVTDRNRIDTIVAAARPDFIFHAAALKHVDLVEENPEEGVLVNVFGTRNVADAAKRHGVGVFVLVSTDKAVSPTSIMGASKRVAEQYVQGCNAATDNSSTRFVAVRFGNVLGSSGSVVPAFEKQISRGGPLTLTDPAVERYFMTVDEARMLIMHATLIATKAERFQDKICVLDMGKPVLIGELAKQMILLSGKRPGVDIQIVHTGLRPGEKLREELIDRNEQLLEAESRDGVMIVHSSHMELDTLQAELARLYQACRRGNRAELRAALGRLVETAALSRSEEFGPGEPSLVPALGGDSQEHQAT
jgi:FlaA1/EpsC-like NDP-sugar epimerase